MGEETSRIGSLWREARRRHVVRVGIAYAAVAFVVLQIAEIVLPAFSFRPDAWIQLIVALSLLGIPLVLVLAWVYELTPDGVRRMADLDASAGHESEIQPIYPRIALLVVTVLTVGMAGWWAVRATVQSGSPLVTPAGTPAVELVSYDPSAPILSLAVLPLENFTESGEQDFFSAGMHDALVARLSQLPGLRVVSRTSVQQYIGTTKTAPLIGQELGVDALIEGSVLRDDRQVRITVQLIHAPSDTHIWSNDYTGSLDDIIALQGEVAQAIAVEIQGELLPEERQTLTAYKGSSEVPTANEELMKGRMALEQGTPEGVKAAQGHFARAIEEDPEFAMAYAEQARVKLELGLSDPDSLATMIPGAKELVATALRIDGELPEAIDVMAFIEDMEDGSHDHTVPAPAGAPDVLSITGPEVGAFRFEVGEGDSVAIIVAEKMSDLGRRLEQSWARWAVQGSQRNRHLVPERMVHAAELMHVSGNSDGAMEMLQALVTDEPTVTAAWETMERILASQDRFGEILELRRRRAAAGQGGVAVVEELARGMEARGSESYWDWKLNELQQMLSAGEDVSYVDLAIAYVEMGDTDGAIAYLEEAARHRDRRLVSERDNPVWDPLRQDQRFRQLMGRIRPVSIRRPSGR
jgi:FimV-like protein